MEQITAADLAKAAEGRLLCGDPSERLLHISLDSRTMKGQDLFVPLIGERVDAHNFIEQAFQSGARAVLTSRHNRVEDSRVWISVKDTKKALQQIGSYYRSRLTLPLIGVTGSVGKTTTREMVAAALSGSFRVYKTPGNSNSQVGVPITLSEISSKDEIGVLELGMSLPGEMTVIAKIARVHQALITNIGVSHIEQLRSQEAILSEKLKIQDGMEAGGILFLNGDDPLLRNVKAKPGCKTVFYGMEKQAEYQAVDVCMEKGFPEFTAVCRGRTVFVRLSVMGRHNVLNAMAALAVADENGVPLEEAAKGLGSFTGYQGRQQIFQSGEIQVIDDSYNASPISMKAGLEVLCAAKTSGRRIAVLADMKELGPQAVDFHRQIGQWVSQKPIDGLLTLGGLAGEIAAKAKLPLVRTFEANELEALWNYLEKLLQPGDCVLLKGSNSMRLSTLADRLRNREKRKTDG